MEKLRQEEQLEVTTAFCLHNGCFEDSPQSNKNGRQQQRESRDPSSIDGQTAQQSVAAGGAVYLRWKGHADRAKILWALLGDDDSGPEAAAGDDAWNFPDG